MRIRCGPATVIGEAPPCRRMPLPSPRWGSMPGIATAPTPGAGRRRDAVNSHQPGGLPTGYVSGCTARTSERMTYAAPPRPAPNRVSANRTSANPISASGHGARVREETGLPCPIASTITTGPAVAIDRSARSRAFCLPTRAARRPPPPSCPLRRAAPMEPAILLLLRRLHRSSALTLSYLTLPCPPSAPQPIRG